MTTTTWNLGGDLTVNRLGYGAMQLAGPGVSGPPKDPEAARTVLRKALELGVDHIDTSDYYGPYVTNELIREALHPYPAGLVIVTKVGARRTPDGGWVPAADPEEIRQAVHDNLKRLDLERMDVVNMRAMDGASIAAPFEALAELRSQGLIRYLGVSNVNAAQLAEAQAIAPVVCVQNMYNLAHREDDALVDATKEQGIAYTPFFPLGGFTPLQDERLARTAQELGATPMQVALAWLLHRSPNILLIPGTSSVEHLVENMAAADLDPGPLAGF